MCMHSPTHFFNGLVRMVSYVSFPIELDCCNVSRICSMVIIIGTLLCTVLILLLFTISDGDQYYTLHMLLLLLFS